MRDARNSLVEYNLYVIRKTNFLYIYDFHQIPVKSVLLSTRSHRTMFLWSYPKLRYTCSNVLMGVLKVIIGMSSLTFIRSLTETEILMEVPSLTAFGAVILTTPGVSSDENFVHITFPFHCLKPTPLLTETDYLVLFILITWDMHIPCVNQYWWLV